MLKIKESVVEIQFSDLIWHSMERLAAHLASIQPLLITLCRGCIHRLQYNNRLLYCLKMTL